MFILGYNFYIVLQPNLVQLMACRNWTGIHLIVIVVCITLMLQIGVSRDPRRFSALWSFCILGYSVSIVLQPNLVQYFGMHRRNSLCNPFDNSRSLYNLNATNRGGSQDTPGGCFEAPFGLYFMIQCLYCSATQSCSILGHVETYYAIHYI